MARSASEHRLRRHPDRRFTDPPNNQQAAGVVEKDPRPSDSEYTSAAVALLATFVALYIVAAIAHPALVGLG